MLYHINLNNHIYVPGIYAYMCTYVCKSSCIYVWLTN